MLSGIFYTQLLKPLLEEINDTLLDCPTCGKPAKYVKTVGEGNVVRCDEHGRGLAPFIVG